MNLAVSSDEVRKTLESVRDSTENPEVRRVMDRALEMYRTYSEPVQAIDPRLSAAVTALLSEMAKTKRLERTILWLGPVVALAVTAVLFAALRTLWLGL